VSLTPFFWPTADISLYPSAKKPCLLHQKARTPNSCPWDSTISGANDGGALMPNEIPDSASESTDQSPTMSRAQSSGGEAREHRSRVDLPELSRSEHSPTWTRAASSATSASNQRPRPRVRPLHSASWSGSVATIAEAGQSDHFADKRIRGSATGSPLSLVRKFRFENEQGAAKTLPQLSHFDVHVDRKQGELPCKLSCPHLRQSQRSR